MQVDLAVVIQVAVNAALLVGLVIGGVKWIKGWLQKQVVDPATKTYQQVAPNGGTQESTRHLIEQMAGDMEGLREVGATNRDIATAAQVSADLAHKRLDDHIAKPHKEF